MPAIAFHSRSPPGAVDKPIPSPLTPESGKGKRLGFLRHLKPGHRTQSSNDAEQRTSIEHDSLQPPTSTTPIKRATAPLDRTSKSQLGVPPAQYTRARSLSPRSAAALHDVANATQENNNAAGNSAIPDTSEARPEFKSRPFSNDSQVSYKSDNSLDSAASPVARGVRFAGNVKDSRPQSRRLSASSTGTRRKSSIYFKNTEGGGYVDGVEQGTGTKARRLSIQLPTELFVDEDRLEDFFDLLSRLGKKKIGEGGAACVQLMKSKKAGDDQHKVFAVKEFRPWDSEEEDELDYQRKIKSEYSIAKACLHPNIVQTFRLCFSGDEWFHVMEYCDLGDLNDLIKKDYMNQEDRNCLFKQLLRGVDYLHARGISHRDLKSENLLVTHHGCLKIADFGTSEVFCGEHPGARNCRQPSIIRPDQKITFCKPGIIGSRPYMAPELVERKHSYDPRGVDVWSCAIVYLSLCFNGTPWDSASSDQNNYNIFCASWDEWLENNPDGEIEIEHPLPSIAQSKLMKFTTPHAKTMIMGMLHPDPSHRWTVKKALDLVCNKEGYGPWPCCQQDGYSDDIKLREKKVRHNHIPPDKRKKNGEFAGK